MRIFCDFDGTISDQDSTDLILQRLAPAEWLDVEADWEAGKIDAAECMRVQIAMIRASLGAVQQVLDQIGLRPGFVDFVEWTRRAGIPLTIVSDGVDYFISYVLGRLGFDGLPVLSNRLVPHDDGGFELAQPHRRSDCGSGVCKCAIVDAAFSSDPLVYIGDGKSDFCVSAKADILFATGRLIDHCVAAGKPHQAFTDFASVQAALEAVLLPSSAQIAA